MKDNQSNTPINLKINKFRHTLELLITILNRHQEIIEQRNHDFFSDESSLIFTVETHLYAFLGEDLDADIITDFVEDYFNHT